jgi:uncharacterized protein (DUF433 family)
MSAEPEPQTEAIDPVGHIVRSPGVMSGRPRIAGSRVRVSDIAAQRYFHGFTPEEIAGEHVYPWVSLADVYAALAYYCDHKDEIDREADADEAFAEKFLLENPDIARRVGG